jgi:hypothetical protein
MQGLEEKSSAPVGDRTPIVQPVVRHYTAWATAAPMISKDFFAFYTAGTTRPLPLYRLHGQHYSAAEQGKEGRTWIYPVMSETWKHILVFRSIRIQRHAYQFHNAAACHTVPYYFRFFFAFQISATGETCPATRVLHYLIFLIIGANMCVTCLFPLSSLI